jgi:hypothetical protein
MLYAGTEPGRRGSASPPTNRDSCRGLVQHPQNPFHDVANVGEVLFMSPNLLMVMGLPSRIALLRGNTHVRASPQGRKRRRTAGPPSDAERWL